MLKADVESLGTSYGEFEDGSKFTDSQINPVTGKRKRGRPRKFKLPTSQEFIDVGSDAARMSPTDFPEEGNSRSNLEDDLQYSSDEDDLDVEDDEDWQEVDNENITVTVEEQRGHFSADDQVQLLLRVLMIS